MNNKIAPVALALTGVAITIIWLGALSFSNNPSFETVNIVGVEAYSDSACAQRVTSINYGNLTPGSKVSHTIYIKNSATTPIELTMLADSWSPTLAASFLTFTWNRQNYVLEAEDTVSATLMLSVASDTVGVKDFNCNINIIGTEYNNPSSS